jgi:hypothetical protein
MFLYDHINLLYKKTKNTYFVCISSFCCVKIFSFSKGSCGRELPEGKVQWSELY